MDYITAEQAAKLDGLRLVVHHGVPGPWAESAKALFRLKGIPFAAVAQAGGGENEDLVAWIRHRNAPVAIYNDDAPRAHWLEILQLAESLDPSPPLLPTIAEERIEVVGLCHEICGQNGFAWHCRLFMIDAMVQAVGETARDQPMVREYGWSDESVLRAADNIEALLSLLDAKLALQSQRGSKYFVGNTMTAVDVYWAYFSQLVAILPQDRNPIPDSLRQFWGAVAPRLNSPVPERLLAHRDFMFDTHLSLPMDF
ncbi:MAG: hypothetical protein NXH85_03840 [Pseudomonadaceae bacterium]|nr:hypothetical protein [Pseudomonadaceae bacterium]